MFKLCLVIQNKGYLIVDLKPFNHWSISLQRGSSLITLFCFKGYSLNNSQTPTKIHHWNSVLVLVCHRLSKADTLIHRDLDHCFLLNTSRKWAMHFCFLLASWDYCELARNIILIIFSSSLLMLTFWGECGENGKCPMKI